MGDRRHAGRNTREARRRRGGTRRGAGDTPQAWRNAAVAGRPAARWAERRGGGSGRPAARRAERWGSREPARSRWRNGGGGGSGAARSAERRGSFVATGSRPPAARRREGAGEMSAPARACPSLMARADTHGSRRGAMRGRTEAVRYRVCRVGTKGRRPVKRRWRRATTAWRVIAPLFV